MLEDREFDAPDWLGKPIFAGVLAVAALACASALALLLVLAFGQIC